MANNEITFNEKEIITSKTDLIGNITYGNSLFIKMSGYSEIDLLGKPHNIIRHPDMPKCVFKLLWDTVQKGEEIFAYVKNLSKSGDYYWVFANVTPDKDLNGKIVGYYSVRRKPPVKAIREHIEPLYKKLAIAENSGGTNAGTKLLEDTLKSANVEYAAFVTSLLATDFIF